VSVATKVLCEAYKGVVRVTLADRSSEQCIVYSLLTREPHTGKSFENISFTGARGRLVFLRRSEKPSLTKAKIIRQH
jgi:hypothetical protein